MLVCRDAVPVGVVQETAALPEWHPASWCRLRAACLQLRLASLE